MHKRKLVKKWVIWEGPSVLDGKPVVLIATTGSPGKENRKTGALLQTYILRADIMPVEATKSGEDSSICGDCVHRKEAQGTCYVRVETGPTNVYKAFKRGVYPRMTPTQSAELMSGKTVRLGSYGDPGAIPFNVWQSVLGQVKGVSGYTHQWKTQPELKAFCMASCDNVQEAETAQASGWRTFTVVSTDVYNTRHGLPVVPHSFLCPASEQAGRKLTCVDCLACGGLSSSNKASVYIPVHGVAYKQARFNNLIQIGG